MTTPADHAPAHPGDAARAYNDRTKFRYELDAGGNEEIVTGLPPDRQPALGAQDPANEPRLFKIYRDLEPIPLASTPIEVSISALDALVADGSRASGVVIPTVDLLARILQRSNGILKRGVSHRGKVVDYRAAGQTGARFHLELYLVAGDLPGLDAGVYHYAAHDHSLRRLRNGDYRAFVTGATGNEPAAATAPAILVFTSEFWRNTWRYLDHTYRQVYWDMGTMVTNTLAMAASVELPAEIVCGFADSEIEKLLGIDSAYEVIAGLVTLGRTDTIAPAAPPLDPIDHAVEPLSPVPSPRFPVIEAAYSGTSFSTGDAVREWRAAIEGATPFSTTSPTDTPAIALRPSSASARSIEDVIEKRRSNRKYAEEIPVSFEDFSTVLTHAASAPRLDVPFPQSDTYLLVNNIAEIEPGAYYFDRENNAIHLLKAGNFREAAKRLCVGQDYPAEANLVAFGLADLEAIYRVYGDRGYRIALLEAAIFGGRMQLAAHALGLGAVGTGSPDEDVPVFFGPHASGKEWLFAAVFGIKRKPTAHENAILTSFLDGERS